MAGSQPTWDAAIDGVCALPIRPLRPLVWERLDDRIRITLEQAGRQVDFRPRIAPVLEALDTATDVPSLVDRAMAADPDRSRPGAIRSVRHLVAGLAQQGYLEIELPPVPEVLAGRYRREAELGRGGIGVVWRCKDLQAGDGDPTVAVKHAWNWSTRLAVAEEHLRQEAQAMAPLDHPGVVRLLDTFEVDGRFHLVRTFVDGDELGRRTMDDGLPGARERRRLTRQVAGILDHLHACNVLCLDVKPANFLVPEDGGPVLTDLGHCRVMQDGVVDLGGAWGTRGFIAPEILDQYQATPRSDVYGLGRFHAFLVLAREPQQGWDRDALVDAVEQAGAEEDELAFVAACCRDEPAQRPPGPTEAVETLA